MTMREATHQLRALELRWDAERKAARFRRDGKFRPRLSRNRLIADDALLREAIPDGHGAEWWITYSPCREEHERLSSAGLLDKLPEVAKHLDPDALNGYVAFPKRSAPELPTNSTKDILAYIPVHGGVTYAVKDSYMAVWGFDTMHYRSESVPRTDRAWVLGQCRLLHTGLLAAAKVWPEWRNASQKRRVELADWLLQLIDDGRVGVADRLTFLAMLDLLRGRIGE